MPTIDNYAPGTFCWLNLVAIGQAKDKEFYRELLGWEAEDVPMVR